MYGSPRLQKRRVLFTRFGQQAPKVRSRNVTLPRDDRDPVVREINLRLSTVPEYMDMRRCMVIGENHEPEPECVMHRDHWAK
jgi:hypothetical protein